MYKNHVESLREAVDFKKNLQENIFNIIAKRDPFLRVVTSPLFEHISPT